ncbi:uncharacterized protein LOC121681668 [Alosa sapidissima]|uniref:uncharacterized protein LOC121681668 n=1 Tax=Alosa sapidissima TaxID=34773 RepID=UPI001C0868B4|nr:uncharacterized protein LOC121681668 [Alosa sapidissima]
MFWIFVFTLLKMYSTYEIVQINHAIEADPGDTVTLACFYSAVYDSELKYWYRQVLGLKPQVIVKYSSGAPAWNSPFSEEFDRGRMTTQQSERSFNLTIRNITSSDEATYYCTGTVYSEIRFENGTFLTVTGPKRSYEHAAFLCAVTNSWCGQINNGNTSDLNAEKSLSPVVCGLIAILGLCFLHICFLVHLIYQYRKHKHNRDIDSHPFRPDFARVTNYSGR